jgi:hypothetical protein
MEARRYAYLGDRYTRVESVLTNSGIVIKSLFFAWFGGS